MTRLPLPLLALLVVTTLAGCAFPVGSQVGTPTDVGTPAVEPFPAFPDAPTDDTVGSYVAAFEESYRHNAILASADGVTSVSVACDPTAVQSTGDGFEVTVGCGFSWMFEADGSVGIADGVPYEATYRVSAGGLTERVGSTL